MRVHSLIQTGAGFNSLELHRISADSNLSCFKVFAQSHPSIDRNEGLLSITTKGILETEYWAGGSVVIDLASKTIDFGVVNYIFPEDEEYKELLAGGVSSYLLCPEYFDDDSICLSFDSFSEFYADIAHGECEFLVSSDPRKHAATVVQIVT